MSAPPIPIKALKDIEVAVKLTKLRNLLLGTSSVLGPAREILTKDFDGLRQTIYSVTMKPEQYESLLKSLEDEIAKVKRSRMSGKLAFPSPELDEIRASLNKLRDQAAGMPRNLDGI